MIQYNLPIHIVWQSFTMYRRQFSTKQIDKHRDKLLRKLIKHSFENVPYYQKIKTSRGISEKDIIVCDDLVKMPILKRKDVVEFANELIARNIDSSEYVIKTTSGSTGEPASFARDKNRRANTCAKVIRRKLLNGESLLFEKTARFPSANHSMFLQGEHYSFLQGINCIKPFNLDNSFMIEDVIKWSPNSLYGLPSLLKELAERQPFSGALKVKFVISHSEPLTKGELRMLQESFQAKVVDEYGLEELGDVAFTCGRDYGAFHVNSDYYFVEILGDNYETLKPGQNGRIVITDLLNHALPFIRYDSGDFGTYIPEACPCGSNLMRISRNIGRERSKLQNDKGEWITLGALDIFDNLIFSIYRITQKISNNEVAIEYAPSTSWCKETFCDIQLKFQKLLGPGVHTTYVKKTFKEIRGIRGKHGSVSRLNI